MRSPEEYALVREFASEGVSPAEIARCTAIPRGTVKDWLAGKVPRGWHEGANESCQLCGHPRHDFAALPPAYMYLFGVYLGDGCISRARRGVFRLRIVLDLAHPNIIDECENAIRAVMPRNKVHRLPRSSRYTGRDEATHVEVSSYSKSWPCLFPQHGPGRKHQRGIELAGWQLDLAKSHAELLLRGLIHSDGCRFINTGRGGWRHPRYVFSNLSDDIRSIFKNACDEFGVQWSDSKNAVYVSRVSDVARLDEVIGPKT